ncbi:hypothetical protein Tco_0208532, partial [Tanacetum coccineum]
KISQRSHISAFNVNAPNRGNFQRSQTSTSFSRPSNNNRPNDNGNRRKNVPNNAVGTSSSSGFSDEQLSTLISLIKENSINGKCVQANMAVWFILSLKPRELSQILGLINTLPLLVDFL